ncbi:MAG: tRNA pseudouridine(55) synthase TruB [Clostridia bacterium]|nr:tRNA pseudouridine(55) synthase TruB [Clostridia bacterium]
MSLETIQIEPDGILLVDKPAGMTSHDVVFRVRKLYSTKKVGHTGTLDPLATGVLVVLLGRAAKACEYVSHDEKVYEAILRLGLTTDTEDVTGSVLTNSSNLPAPAEVEAVLPSFRGEILQIPPMYSALKVNGRKLCDMARSGETVEREARPVTVKSLVCEPTDSPADYRMTVRVSGGTYIRTLCADIGSALGCGGVMATLRRTEAGGFPIEDCVTLEALEDMEPDKRLSLLRPVEELFGDLEALHLPDFYRTLCRNGCEIYLGKLGVSFPVGKRLRLCDRQGRFFALGKVGEYEDGIAVKAIKIFVL